MSDKPPIAPLLTRNDITKNGVVPNVENDIVLVFDFETSRLPDDEVVWEAFRPEEEYATWPDGNPKYKKKGTTDRVILPASDPSKWPHSVQISYLTYNNDTKELNIFNERIKLPAGVKVNPDSEKIHHISTEEANTKGVPIETAMDRFIVDYNNANVIVAHNIHFDRNMILVELKRLTERTDITSEDKEKYHEFMMKFYKNKKEYCTSRHGAEICNVVDKYKSGFNVGKEYYKMPKLMDLYEKLFGYSPDESKLHDAKVDVIVCFRCFYKLRYGKDIYEFALSGLKIKEEIDDIDPHANEKVSADPSPGRGGNAPSVKLILTEPESQFNLHDIGNKIDEEVERGDDIILKFMNDNADVNEKIDGSMPRRSKRLSEQPKIDYAEGVSRPKKKRATRKKRKTNDSQPLRRSKRNQNKKTSKPPVNKPKKYSKKKKAAKKPKTTVAKNTKKKRKTKGRKQTK